MKVTRGDFFKLLGGGAGAAVVASQVTGTELATIPKVEPPAAPRVEFHPIKAPYENTAPGKDAFGIHHQYYYDVQPWIMYDRFTGEDLNRARNHRAFNRLQSNHWDFCDSNMLCSGELPAPEQMIVNGIMVLMDRDTPDNHMADFERNVAGRMCIGQRYYQSAPMSRLAIRASLDTLTNRTPYGSPNGHVTAKIFQLPIPLLIMDRQNFAFEMASRYMYRSPESLSGYVLLDGYLARGVQ